MEIKNWLDGEWALILGSSSGFGAEVSIKLSEYGVNITVSYTHLTLPTICSV